MDTGTEFADKFRRFNGEQIMENISSRSADAPLPPIHSVLARLDTINERLYSLASEARDHADRMFGPLPQDSTNGEAMPIPESLLAQLDQTLLHVENNLGTLQSEVRRNLEFG